MSTPDGHRREGDAPAQRDTALSIATNDAHVADAAGAGIHNSFALSAPGRARP